MRSSGRRRAWGLAAALLGALVAVAWLLHDTGGPAAATDATAPAFAQRRAVAAGLPSTSSAAAERVADRAPAAEQDGRVSLTTSGDILHDYLKSSIYPPHSRPLTEQMVDLLDPRQPVPHPPFKVPNDTEVSYVFTADRYWVTGGETVHAFLRVMRGDEILPVQVVDAYASVIESPNENVGARIPLHFAPDGGFHVSAFRPGATELGGEVSLLKIGVAFTYEGAPKQTETFVQIHYTPKVPARFTGEFSEQVVDGSLIVSAGIDVRKPGFYLIDANLYDATDRPIAWSRHKGPLPAGRTTVELLFFGKVLIDRDAAPPFTVRQLRGELIVDGQTPNREPIPMWEGEYVTRAVSLDMLSDRDWDSAEKRATVAAMMALPPGERSADPELTGDPFTAPAP